MSAGIGYPQPGDAALVRRACRGDASASRLLVDRQAPRLYAAAAAGENALPYLEHALPRAGNHGTPRPRSRTSPPAQNR